MEHLRSIKRFANQPGATTTERGRETEKQSSVALATVTGFQREGKRVEPEIERGTQRKRRGDIYIYRYRYRYRYR